jgi:hypothetical protein
LPTYQQIETSDGYTSTDEPAIWRNDSAGWSEDSTIEPAVTYELTDPENVAIRKDGLPALRVNDSYLKEANPGDIINGEVVRGDGAYVGTYIDVPQDVDDAVSEWNDRMAANERVDNTAIADALLAHKFEVDQNILDSERQFYPPIQSVRTLPPLQQENRELVNQIIANSPQNVARRNEEMRQANMAAQQPVVVNTQEATQPVVVNTQPTQQPVVKVVAPPQSTQQPTVAVRTEQPNSGGVSESAQGFNWNTLSQEQKLMLLGLGGLGAYGLYDAVNQPQQQSYAVRAA